MKKYLLIIALFLISTTDLVQAKSAGECGAVGLKFPPTARAMGMGETMTAVGDDINALYFNPAGLAGIDREFSSCYQDGILDSSYTCFSYSQATNVGGLGLILGLLDGGKAAIYEFNGTERNLNTQKDIYLHAGLGRILKENLKVGGGIKIISSKLAEEYNASGIGIDVGLLMEKNGKNLGVSLQNLGLGLKYENEKSCLPAALRIGGTVRPEGIPLILALEGKKVLDERFSLGLGSEYWCNGFLALRLGYKTGNENQGIAGGFGIRHQKLQFDYAFVPIKNLDSNHRISLLLRF